MAYLLAESRDDAPAPSRAAAAVETKILADKIDAELLAACGGIANDLGDSTVFLDGQAACNAARKSIEDTKAKLGPNVAIKLDVDEPECAFDLKAYGDCASRCDATVKSGSANVQCDGKLQGTCPAQCAGDCRLSAAATCSGTCSGSCDAKVSGSCAGTCAGTCDGKPTPAGVGATCAGHCEGTCSGTLKGVCGGNCGGDCRSTEGASCSGTCTGDCSVAMEVPRCAGNIEPPQMSATCQTKCDAQVQAQASCTPPRVGLTITGATDPLAAVRLRLAIEKGLPRVVDVGKGIGKNVAHISDNVVALVRGSQSVVQAAMADKVFGTALVACVGMPYANAIAAATRLTANVKVSVDVAATASIGGKATSG